MNLTLNLVFSQSECKVESSKSHFRVPVRSGHKGNELRFFASTSRSLVNHKQHNRRLTSSYSEARVSSRCFQVSRTIGQFRRRGKSGFRFGKFLANLELREMALSFKTNLEVIFVVQ